MYVSLVFDAIVGIIMPTITVTVTIPTANF